VATAAKPRPLAQPGRRPLPGNTSGGLRVGAAVVNKVSQGESRLFLIVIGVMAVVFALILPITAIMYMDILAMRAVVKEELIKVIKARKELEKDRQITKEE
jgi:hypothetical protein